MDIIFWGIVAAATIMYLEGGAITALVSTLMRLPRTMSFFVALLWPLALPYLTFKAVKALQPIIEQVNQLKALQANPFMEAMMAGNINTEEVDKDLAGQKL